MARRGRVLLGLTALATVVAVGAPARALRPTPLKRRAGAAERPAVRPAPVHALYVYTSRALTDSEARVRLFAEARRRGVNVLYVNAYPALCASLAPGRGADLDGYAQGVAEARRQGLGVEVLLGQASWIASPTDRAWMVRNLLAPAAGLWARDPAERPLAVHLDEEPHQLPQWRTNPPAANLALIGRTLSLYAEVATVLRLAAGTAVPVAVDVPAWWALPQFRLAWGGDVDTALGHTLVQVDRVTVMAYAGSPREVVAKARPGVALARVRGRQVVVAVETDPAPALSEVSLGAGPRLAEGLGLLSRDLGDDPGFAGWAVHAYELITDQATPSVSETGSLTP